MEAREATYKDQRSMSKGDKQVASASTKSGNKGKQGKKSEKETDSRDKVCSDCGSSTRLAKSKQCPAHSQVCNFCRKKVISSINVEQNRTQLTKLGSA